MEKVEGLRIYLELSPLPAAVEEVVEEVAPVDPAALEAAEAAALTAAVEMVVAMVQMEKVPDIKEEQDKDQPREHSERLTESCVQVAEVEVQDTIAEALDQTEPGHTGAVDTEGIRGSMEAMEEPEL